ncbi:hypothetical protein EVAR_83809_1 [Eumeta japonica]|uniref:Uncharacterized protein n=1 Tax=Eumeta variegata TaxID=151549 RepID=A0A4C1WG84_EUMVA|nr:hypothetical protein EVAR_83809_1 [Eumeta japonica]
MTQRRSYTTKQVRVVAGAPRAARRLLLRVTYYCTTVLPSERLNWTNFSSMIDEELFPRFHFDLYVSGCEFNLVSVPSSGRRRAPRSPSGSKRKRTAESDITARGGCGGACAAGAARRACTRRRACAALRPVSYRDSVGRSASSSPTLPSHRIVGPAQVSTRARPDARSVGALRHYLSFSRPAVERTVQVRYVCRDRATCWERECLRFDGERARPIAFGACAAVGPFPSPNMYIYTPHLIAEPKRSSARGRVDNVFTDKLYSRSRAARSAGGGARSRRPKLPRPGPAGPAESSPSAPLGRPRRRALSRVMCFDVLRLEITRYDFLAYGRVLEDRARCKIPHCAYVTSDRWTGTPRARRPALDGLTRSRPRTPLPYLIDSIG